MSNVTGKVKDAPLFWLPYLIVPVKTIRQSGLLFPRLGVTEDGFRYVIPFFWAINRSSDMTIAAGDYGGRGFRLETEGRYKLSDRGEGIANFYYLRDQKFQQAPNRWALNVGQTQELPLGITQKLKILEVSDNNYPVTFGDIPGQNEAFIASDLIFSHSTSQVSSYVAARRFRNLVNLDPNGVVEFDNKTVQVYPTVGVQTNDRPLLWDLGIVGGLRLGVTNFTRASGPFDNNPADRTGIGDFPVPGFDPIRKATRYSITPSAYKTFRAWDVISIVPSVEYRAYYYDFHGAFDYASLSSTKNLARGYGLTRTEVSTQWEKIYSTDNPDIPRVKHLIRPFVSHSWIPFVNSDESHPFIRQIEYARQNQLTGFNFDNNDIVPFEGSKTYTNYYTPLGHSLSYGFTTQVIRRRGRAEDPTAWYQRSFELRAGQTFDIREATKRDVEQGKQREPFSRFFSTLGFEFDRWSSYTDYVYVPYLPVGPDLGVPGSLDQNRHVLATSFTYVLERTLHQQILSFERSFSIGYVYNIKREAATNILRGTLTYSVSDYVLPSVYVSYDLITKRYQEAGASLRFQSPSRCWRIDLSARGTICRESAFCIQRPAVDLSLNLTGEGFGGVGDVAKSASASPTQ
jgi:LPS-assembly protein